jgi:hypothetical protein
LEVTFGLMCGFQRGAIQVVRVLAGVRKDFMGQHFFERRDDTTMVGRGAKTIASTFGTKMTRRRGWTNIGYPEKNRREVA